MTHQRSLLIYYSRTGTTRKVAEALSQVLDCDIEEIVEARSRVSLFGYLRSVVEARRQHPAAIAATRRDPSAYDLVIIGTPVWAWSVSSPVRAYLMTMTARLPDVAFFCTLGGAGAARTFAQMQDLTGKNPRLQCAVTAREVSSGHYREVVAAFAKALESMPGGNTATPPSLSNVA